MLYEFELVAYSSKELHEKDIQAEVQGITSVEFFNQEDWISKYTLDLSRVISFRQTKVYLNEAILDAVVAELDEGGIFTPALIIPYNLFKDLFEKENGVVIKKAI